MRELHHFYMDVAVSASKLSYCMRNKVGAVLVKDKNIISFSYNGTPSGFPNVCENEDGTTNNLVLHAESNALAKSMRAGNSTDGAILYTTVSPCVQCAKLIIQSGVKEVYFKEFYRMTDGIDLLSKAGISVYRFPVKAIEL